MLVNDAARLTADEIKSIPRTWDGGYHWNPRDVADAATAKAEAYWQGRVRELVAVAKAILTLNVLDGFRERRLRAALAPFRERVPGASCQNTEVA